MQPPPASSSLAQIEAVLEQWAELAIAAIEHAGSRAARAALCLALDAGEVVDLIMEYAEPSVLVAVVAQFVAVLILEIRSAVGC